MMRDAMDWLKEQRDVEDLVLFLDFDGTLAPIVERPGQAKPLEGVRELVESLGEEIPVAVISGRGLDDVMERLGAKGIYYSGSHGMEIADPEGSREESQEVQQLLPILDEVEGRMRQLFGDDEALEVERKRFGVAVHFRRKPRARQQVEQALAEAVGNGEGLKMGFGKMVREIQPDVDQHKGTALRRITEQMGRDEANGRSVYIGDDKTDEDAFEVVADQGYGILVAAEDRPSAAALRLDDPYEVRQFLEALVERLR